MSEKLFTILHKVSNDRREGCTGVGRTGWHIDGTFMSKPFAYQTMHFPSVNREGHTQFVSLKHLYEEQTEALRQKWSKRWFEKRRWFSNQSESHFKTVSNHH